MANSISLMFKAPVPTSMMTQHTQFTLISLLIFKNQPLVLKTKYHL